jgi:hypothetical protein
MTDGNTNVNGRAGAILFAASTALAFLNSGKFGEHAATYMNEYWPVPLCVGALASLFFVLMLWQDGRPTPPAKQVIGQAGVTFLVTALVPPIMYSYYSKEPKIGEYACEVFGGGLFTWTTVAGIDEWVRAKRKQGTWGETVLRTVAGVVTRLGPGAAGGTSVHTALTLDTTEVRNDDPARRPDTQPVPVRPAAPAVTADGGRAEQRPPVGDVRSVPGLGPVRDGDPNGQSQPPTAPGPGK